MKAEDLNSLYLQLRADSDVAMWSGFHAHIQPRTVQIQETLKAAGVSLASFVKRTLEKDAENPFILPTPQKKRRA